MRKREKYMEDNLRIYGRLKLIINRQRTGPAKHFAILSFVNEREDRVSASEMSPYPPRATKKAVLSISVSFLAASFRVVRAVREGPTAACVITHSRPKS